MNNENSLTGHKKAAQADNPSKNINRRQFLKISAASTVLGTSALSGNNNPLLTRATMDSASQSKKDFPVIITDKCKRMDQKNTIFARQLWDYDFVKKIESTKQKPTIHADKGWGHLDNALDAAGWAVDNKFASGSENGQPHSLAYTWDEPVRKKKFKFGDSDDASRFQQPGLPKMVHQS